MKAGFLFFVAFLILIRVEAQQLQGADAYFNAEALASGGSMFRSFDNRFKGVEGYPTLYTKYAPGLIQMTSGKWFTHDSINYDAYNDDLLVKRNLNEVVVSKGMVTSFIVIQGDDSISFSKVIWTESKNRFVRIPFTGKVTLYASESKIVSAPTNSGAYSNGRTYSEFVYKKSFYLKGDALPLTEIKTKKDVLAMFSSLKSEIDSFIKENKINFKKEGDLIKLVTHIDQLL